MEGFLSEVYNWGNNMYTIQKSSLTDEFTQSLLLQIRGYIIHWLQRIDFHVRQSGFKLYLYYSLDLGQFY